MLSLPGVLSRSFVLSLPRVVNHSLVLSLPGVMSRSSVEVTGSHDSLFCVEFT